MHVLMGCLSEVVVLPENLCSLFSYHYDRAHDIDVWQERDDADIDDSEFFDAINLEPRIHNATLILGKHLVSARSVPVWNDVGVNPPSWASFSICLFEGINTPDVLKNLILACHARTWRNLCLDELGKFGVLEKPTEICE